MVPPRHPHLRSCLPSCKPCPAAVILLSRYSHPILWSPGSTTRPRAFPEEETMILTETTLAATPSTATASLRPQPGECTPYDDLLLSLLPPTEILPALQAQSPHTHPL